nr:tetratricopeptide repeat protein [Tolypothrix sp. FACHB-123]
MRNETQHFRRFVGFHFVQPNLQLSLTELYWIMTLELTDWDKDLPTEGDEEYQALVRTLNFTEGFGLLFVRCSPAEGEQLITKVKEDITNKNIAVLRLEQAVNNLYEIIENLDNQKKINILFITGLEQSFYEYEECKSLAGWNSRDIYSYSWKGVPPVLINLNQQRERFRDNFNICFVFLLPIFAIKYFIQRAPDFFDWRSGLFEFPIKSEILDQESSRIIQDGDYEKYLAFTPEETTKEILRIQELIAENNRKFDIQKDLFINLGNLQCAGKDYKQALISFSKALEIQADDYYALNNRGYALEKLGSYEEAIASFDKALEIQSDEYAWYLRGIALEKLGRYEEAIVSFDKALEIQPEFHNVWYDRGIVLRILGRYDEAIASYDKALEIKPDYHEAWNNRGYALGILEVHEEAITSFDKALLIKPDLHEAWYNRGIALRILRRYEQAISSYDKAVSIKSDYHEAWYNRGIALRILGRYEEAISSYEQALSIKPDDSYAWNNRGIALANIGRNEEAIVSFKKVLEIKPDDYQAWYNWGNALGKLRHYEDAIIAYEQAINIKPDYQHAWGNRGYALQNLGRYKEALESLEKALEIQPDYYPAWYNKACCYALQGNIEQALENLQQAINLNPEKYREMVKTDSDFDSIREDERFQALIQG